jgi:peroxiredoxin
MTQPPVDVETLGPQVGEMFPPVVLKRENGQTVDLHRDRDGRPALVVFYRSARW